MRARDVEWLASNAVSPCIDDGDGWFRVLAFLGLTIPDFPADLLDLCGGDA